MCKAHKSALAGIATIELTPLSAAGSRVLGQDKRKPIDIVLHCENGPVDQAVSLDQGPWLATWKQIGKSIRLEIGQNDKHLNATSVLGACVSSAWHCRLNTTTVSNRLNVRDNT